MDATAGAVVGTGITILISVGTAFRSLRTEMRRFREHIDERIDGQGESLRNRIDAQGEDLCTRIEGQGEDLRKRIDAQGEDLRNRIDAQGKETAEQLGQVRERMAKLEGLLEGLREAITGKRAA